MTARARALFLLPAALLAGAGLLVPVVRVAQLALTRTEASPERGLVNVWAGLDPILRLFDDGRFLADLGTTLVFTGASVALELVLGVALALVLNARSRLRPLLRAAVLLPWALPTAVMALAWRFIFDDTFGVLNDILRRLGLLERPIAWLGEPGYALAALVVADVWKTTPFVGLVVLAGLQAIPSSVLEAARVDGLSRWHRLRHVVLPLLAPSIAVAVAFRLVQAFGAFDLVYVMTGGGPGGSTETVSLYAFQSFFRYLDFGHGAAVALASALLALTLAAAFSRLARPRWAA